MANNKYEDLTFLITGVGKRPDEVTVFYTNLISFCISKKRVLKVLEDFKQGVVTHIPCRDNITTRALLVDKIKEELGI